MFSVHILSPLSSSCVQDVSQESLSSETCRGNSEIKYKKTKTPKAKHFTHIFSCTVLKME